MTQRPRLSMTALFAAPFAGPGVSRLAAVYATAVALVTMAYIGFSAHVSQSWIMGEWLINYRGGFMRRGLIGEAIWQGARAAHRSPMAVAVLLQAVLYGGFYAAAWRLTRGVRWTVPLIALFFSPATLAFIPLDPPSSVRKEVLLFVAVALVALVLRGGEETGSRRGVQPPGQTPVGQTLRATVLLALALLVAASCIVLAHEGLVFFLPYLFAPVFLAGYRGGDRARAAALVCLPAAVAGVTAAIASALHPGDRQTAAAICRSLGGTMEGDGHGFCGGAIAYLAHDRAYAHADLLRAAHAYHYGVLYGVTGGLALLPVVALLTELWQRRRRFECAVLVVSAVVAGAGSLVLFGFARDWGRWISIHATSLLLLLLFVHRGDRTDESAGDRPRAVARVSGVAGIAALLVVYATCWNLPAAGNYHPRLGYFGLARYFAGYSTAPHSSSGLR